MRIGRPSLDTIALMTMSMACDLTTFVMPLIVGAMVTRHGLSDATAGFVATAQLMGCALLSFAMAAKVRDLPPRATIVVGLILVALGSAATLVAHNLALLVAARLSCGFGEALVNVIVAVLIAGKPDPDRGYAMINIGITFGAVIVFVIEPWLSPYVAADGVFWILAALPIIPFVFLRGVPTARLGRMVDAIKHGAPPSKAAWLTPAAIAILTAVVGFGVAGNAIFVFIERIGESIGVSYVQMDRALLWATVWTAVGPVVARSIGLRFGRMPVLIFAFVGLAIADPMMGSPSSPWVLFMGLNLGGFTLLLAAPYYCGMMAAMDPSGRLVTLSRGVVALGSAVTPSIASLMLMSGGGFRAMGDWSAVIALASLGFLLYAGRSAGRLAARMAEPVPEPLAASTSGLPLNEV